MLKIKTTKNFFFNSPAKKIFFTFLILFIYRFCNTIPLSGIDQEALKQTYQSTIIPEAEEIAMNHSTMFNLDGKTEWLELDYSHIPVLQENQVEKARVNKLLTESIKTLKDLLEDKSDSGLKVSIENLNKKKMKPSMISVAPSLMEISITDLIVFLPGDKLCFL